MSLTIRAASSLLLWNKIDLNKNGKQKIYNHSIFEQILKNKKSCPVKNEYEETF